jgi:hypothetical protein
MHRNVDQARFRRDERLRCGSAGDHTGERIRDGVATRKYLATVHDEEAGPDGDVVTEADRVAGATPRRDGQPRGA